MVARLKLTVVAVCQVEATCSLAVSAACRVRLCTALAQMVAATGTTHPSTSTTAAHRWRTLTAL